MKYLYAIIIRVNIPMPRTKIAKEYSSTYLEIDRPQPLSDNKIEQMQLDVLNGKLDKDITDAVYDNFKQETEKWILSSPFNTLSGLDNFVRKDIIIGCTQFIDNLYMQGPVQVLQGDYKYHHRLGNWSRTVGGLSPNIPLIIAMPFPGTGSVHDQMTEILDEAQDKGISVHVDGAWLTCCRGIDFDLLHPSIKSVGISLSKGLGLGWNRIGLRWTKETKSDSITIMNDFHMNNRALAMIGLHFIRNLPADYLWFTHGERYYKVCRDFELTPTRSIHLALRNNQPVGVSPLIRYLENASS
jgi:hypothetical protein